MTILAVCQRASTVLGLNVPTMVFGATDRELLELQDVANEAGEDIAKAYDWQALKTIATVTGDGATQDFSLTAITPAYLRMLNKATVWVTSRPFYPLEHVPDTDMWLGIVLSGLQVSTGQWTIYGNQIHIRPALAAADTAKFYYITKNVVQPAVGSNQQYFVLDTDSFVLDERLLRLAIIWRWKANKGLPYAEDMASYEIALQEAVARDKGSKIITVGQQRYRGGHDIETAFPGTLG